MAAEPRDPARDPEHGLARADDRDGPADELSDDLRVAVKRALRERMRGLRGALSARACAVRSARIAESVLALDAVAQARAVALFAAIEERREVDLTAVDAGLRARGVRVAYPAVVPGERVLAFRFVADPSAMARTASGRATGIREPSAADPMANPQELDVIVVPALAVAPTGHRIGYGGGHYDATLPAFAPPASTVAVAFDFQLVAEVPSAADDVALDWVVTDARSFRAERRHGRP